MVRLGVVLVCLAGCEEHCPRTPLEVRLFDGEPVDGTLITECTGNPGLCDIFQDRPASTREKLEGCERGIAVLAEHIGLFSISLALDTDAAGDILAARGAFQTACDDDGCELHTEQARSGWIMPEVVSADGTTRQAGRFHVELDELTIEGDYDTESP